MDIVYATASGHVGGPDGLMLFVRKGTHWPAADPVVRNNPGVFSADPRWGLCTTLALPDVEPAEAEPVQAGPVRRKAVAS